MVAKWLDKLKIMFLDKVSVIRNLDKEILLTLAFEYV